MRSSLKQFFLLFGLFSGFSASSQIVGIAGSKLVAYNAATLDTRTVEFEPTYSIFRSGANWGESGPVESDTLNISSSTCWRLTILQVKLSKSACRQ